MGLGMMVLDDLRKKEGGFGLTARPVGKTGLTNPSGGSEYRTPGGEYGNTSGNEHGNGAPHQTSRAQLPNTNP